MKKGGPVIHTIKSQMMIKWTKATHIFKMKKCIWWLRWDCYTENQGIKVGFKVSHHHWLYISFLRCWKIISNFSYWVWYHKKLIYLRKERNAIVKWIKDKFHANLYNIIIRIDGLKIYTFNIQLQSCKVCYAAFPRNYMLVVDPCAFLDLSQNR